MPLPCGLFQKSSISKEDWLMRVLGSLMGQACRSYTSITSFRREISFSDLTSLAGWWHYSHAYHAVQSLPACFEDSRLSTFKEALMSLRDSLRAIRRHCTVRWLCVPQKRWDVIASAFQNHRLCKALTYMFWRGCEWFLRRNY